MIQINSIVEARTRPTNDDVKAEKPARVSGNGLVPAPVILPVETPSMDAMRECAWEAGNYSVEQRFLPVASHVALAAVSPKSGFIHWRMLHSWIEDTARRKGGAWHQCRMILRVYDVSYVNFNGLNARRILNMPISQICGQQFFTLPLAGSHQLAEVGFELRSGEFIPAARSSFVQFPSDTVCPRTDHAALMVDENLKTEPVANVWNQQEYLNQFRLARVDKPLRIATFAFESLASGQTSILAKFVSELAAAQRARGHQIHLFVPKAGKLSQDCEIDGVHYHPLDVKFDASPVGTAVDFAHVSDEALRKLPRFDLLHLHEWMTGLTPVLGAIPTVFSLSSIEKTRLNGAAPSALSSQIEKIERETLELADCILAPEGIATKISAEFEAVKDRVHPFAMDGQSSPWDAPLDFGSVKKEAGIGPMDRMVLFVGPLEHAAGPDILIDALPVALQRAPNIRMVFVGMGSLHGHLYHRANQSGQAYAAKFLGHVEGARLMNLLRASEVVVLPARHRYHLDEGVVNLARMAGRPVVATHGGPAFAVKHEENGLLTYDNSNSLIWALDRILGHRNNTDRLARNSKKLGGGSESWDEIARRYFEICVKLTNESGDVA